MDSSTLVLMGKILASFVTLSISFTLISFGGMFNKKAGLSNIALEGIMIIGATAGIFITYAFTNAISDGFPSLLAILIAVILSGLFGAIFALMHAAVRFTLKGNQYAAGIGINILGTALFIILAYFLIGEDELLLPDFAKISADTFGGTTASISNFWDSFLLTSFNNLATIIALLLIPICFYISKKTRFGFRLDACEENPEKARRLGLPIGAVRIRAIALAGFLAGVGGFSFLYGLNSSFNGEIYGYGFLALAIVLIGKWDPRRILLTSIMFAALISLGNYALEITWLPNFDGIVQGDKIYNLFPYVLVLIVLSFASKPRKRKEKVEKKDIGK